ncbi:hypothetical protein KC19_10G051400 [Ceratodon purpureus]|uniref:Uncharacterized protein n=1 Tax=Ceratodon purpureus TaxID=3225 RepID=A0A8T0GP05_CERPU|nr:hypothetical protein KC19_10G051400 [Ceratodon purpureus]
MTPRGTVCQLIVDPFLDLRASPVYGSGLTGDALTYHVGRQWGGADVIQPKRGRRIALLPLLPNPHQIDLVSGAEHGSHHDACEGGSEGSLHCIASHEQAAARPHLQIPT